jgi:hypothetical protein
LTGTFQGLLTPLALFDMVFVVALGLFLSFQQLVLDLVGQFWKLELWLVDPKVELFLLEVKLCLLRGQL